MVTNYPQRLTAMRPLDAADLVSRAMTRLGQLFCGIRGHESMLHFEGRRVMMRWHFVRARYAGMGNQ